MLPMNRRALTITLVFALLVSTIAGAFVDLVTANPYQFSYGGEVTPYGETKPPKITIFSPKDNGTYSGSIPFNFNVSVGNSSVAFSRFIYQIYYKTDWQLDNVYLFQYDAAEIFTELSYNLNLTGINEGKHNITVYASERGSYAEGDRFITITEFFINGSCAVFFTIDMTRPIISILLEKRGL